MRLNGEIILIDNDAFEFDLLKECLSRLNYQVGLSYFSTPDQGLAYLDKTQKEIFLIISEMEFDGMGGLQLKKTINESNVTKWKSAPFVFIANHSTKALIDEAYKLNIQGFFKKPAKLEQLTDMFAAIIKYWIITMHPNKSVDFYSYS